MTYGYDNGAGNSAGKKKKFAIIGVSSLILVAMVVAVAVGVKSDNKSESTPATPAAPQISTSTKSIQAICQPTDYRQQCESSLNKVAGNTTDPQKLVQAGFTVAIEALQVAIQNSSTVKALAKDPMASQALEICKELLNTAIEDLEDSFQELGAFDFSKFDQYVANLKVWLSATITYQQTCLNGFENTTGPAGQKMRDILTTSSQLTSNGLAMVTGLATILKDLNIPGLGRRLMEANDGFPSWVDAGQRRLLAATSATIKADAVVAQDGSGQFKTIDEAIKQIPKTQSKTYVLHIKAGVYKEQVTISRSLTNILMIGDGPTKTRISGSLNYADGIQTLKTATVSISGNHFMAKDIGFENTAGAIGHQAVALKVQSDMSVFYNCHIDGHHDTLYAHTYRQFYRECTISGTIDFIFGDAAAVFQNCKMVVRKPIDEQSCTVTAQGRNDSREATGFVLQNCTIAADPAYLPLKETNPAYLGRPAQIYSRTIIMESDIGDFIAPEGWLQWLGSYGLDTLFYSEYNNRGKGAALTQRVKWKGIKKITPQEAEGFTAAKFIDGDLWIPNIGVPYTGGFANKA